MVLLTLAEGYSWAASFHHFLRGDDVSVLWLILACSLDALRAIIIEAQERQKARKDREIIAVFE